MTLLQTGKAQPAPVVLLDVPGGTYWHTWIGFVERELRRSGYISPEDLALLQITDDIGDAVSEILGFYANYHSLRFVDGILVLRMHRAPSPEDLASWNHEFADIVAQGEMRVIDTTAAEGADQDHVDLARVAFRFNRRGWSRLRMLIDRVNGREPASAPLDAAG